MHICRITAPHFCAGLVMNGDTVLSAAPIVSYMIGWTKDRTARYALMKGWKTEWLETTERNEHDQEGTH